MPDIKPGDRALIHREGCLPLPVAVVSIDADGMVVTCQSGPWETVESGKFTVTADYAPDGIDMDGCILLFDSGEGR